MASSRPHVARSLASALTVRLREVLARGVATETELRELSDQAGGWERSLRAQMRAGERRLARLTADASTPITDIAEELRRVEALRPELEEVRGLLAELEERARELRTAWLRAALNRQP
jgi:phage shock protein A